MTMVITGGNQRKAEKIARDIVKGLTVMDIDSTVAEDIGIANEQRLCSAIDGDFLKNERRISGLHSHIRAKLTKDLAELFDEADNLCLRVSITRQKASFALGYQAALRLLGVTPKTKGNGKK